MTMGLSIARLIVLVTGVLIALVGLWMHRAAGRSWVGGRAVHRW